MLDERFFDEIDRDEALAKSAVVLELSDELMEEYGETKDDRIVRSNGAAYSRANKLAKEMSDLEKLARKKAQIARAIINRQKKRDKTIKEYPYSTLIVYFMGHPNTEPRNILHIIEEGQSRRYGGRKWYYDAMELMRKRAHEFQTK